MRITIDIKNELSPSIALECVKRVINQGRVSGNGKYFCYATLFDTADGEVCVVTNPNRKTDCFWVYKTFNENDLSQEIREEIQKDGVGEILHEMQNLTASDIKRIELFENGQ